MSRTPAHFGAVLLALGGVVAVSGVLHGGIETVDMVGVLLAVGSGVLWAVTILATRAVGARWRQLDGLAIALVIAALLVAPAAGSSWAGAAVTWGVVVAAAAVAVLSTVVPYSLELQALRRLDARVFGVLLSLEPAVAAVAGFVLLGQLLDAIEIAGICLVVIASALVVREQAAGPARGDASGA
jgi:inner membrane transporter RhtA